jgi:hypothetical protein
MLHPIGLESLVSMKALYLALEASQLHVPRHRLALSTQLLES